MVGRPQFPKGVPVPDWPPSAPPPQDKRGWNEDWQVGDLAECVLPVDQVWPDDFAENPKRGDVLRVNALVEGLDTLGEALVSGLGFEGKPARHFWAASAFRKLRPAIEAADTEFTAQLREGLGVRQ